MSIPAAVLRAADAERARWRRIDAAHWRECCDELSDCMYWFHLNTGASQWDVPDTVGEQRALAGGAVTTIDPDIYDAVEPTPPKVPPPPNAKKRPGSSTDMSHYTPKEWAAKQREDREANFVQNAFYEELKSLAGTVEEAKRGEGSTLKQLESTDVRSRFELERMQREVEETKGIGTNALNEAEGKLNKFRTSYNQTLSDAEQRYHNELNKDKLKIDYVSKENDQLRGFVGLTSAA